LKWSKFLVNLPGQDRDEVSLPSRWILLQLDSISISEIANGKLYLGLTKQLTDGAEAIAQADYVSFQNLTIVSIYDFKKRLMSEDLVILNE
jgi:hypothetical protein